MNLVQKELEENWLVYSDFKDFEYSIEERAGELYIQGVKLCKLNDIERVYTDEDAIVVNTKKDTFYICIRSECNKKPYICQIYAKWKDGFLYEYYEKDEIANEKLIEATIIAFDGTSEWYSTLIGEKLNLIQNDEKFGEHHYALNCNEDLLVKKIHTNVCN